MNEVIAIQTNEQNEQRVTARDLYKSLGVSKRFSAWFQPFQEMYVEGTDFMGVPGGTPITSGHGRIQYLDNYYLTVAMAKNVAMMSKTTKSQEIRDYFIQVEEQHKALMNNPEFQMAMGLRASQLVIEQKDKLIEEMKPKAVFADAVNVSNQTILVGDLAKLISQNGVQIGQNRLFRWLRDNGYLHKQGSQYNRPTQRYMDQGLFKVKESSHANADGSVKLTFTTKVTGKGQQYFINKFIGQTSLGE